MARIVVLGGSGGIGSVAVRALRAADDGHDVVVADQHPPADGLTVDAASPASLASALTGADVAVNCIGPFYRFGPPVLHAALTAGVDYVDVCDDLAPTRTMLAMDEAARAASVRAVVGIGNSPGLANLLVRMCAEHLLDEVHEVDIMHIHGGEPLEGPAVLKHRIRAMRDPVPLFLDGRFHEVRQLGPDGQAQVRRFAFQGLGDYPVFPYPHPETITLPRHIHHLRRVTNLGVVFPLTYFERTQDLVRQGLDDDAIVATLQAERPGLLTAAGVTGPAGCLAVDVRGLKSGQEHRYVFQLSSQSAGAGEGTGIPVAVAALMMAHAQVNGPGVLPPEAALAPDTFLPLAFEIVRRLGVRTGGGEPVQITHHGPDGRPSLIPLSL
jgi:saccharopine dehydrogenase (NAD+, L-lysine-forming)